MLLRGIVKVWHLPQEYRKLRPVVRPNATYFRLFSPHLYAVKYGCYATRWIQHAPVGTGRPHAWLSVAHHTPTLKRQPVCYHIRAPLHLQARCCQARCCAGCSPLPFITLFNNFCKNGIARTSRPCMCLCTVCCLFFTLQVIFPTAGVHPYHVQEAGSLDNAMKAVTNLAMDKRGMDKVTEVSYYHHSMSIKIAN